MSSGRGSARRAWAGGVTLVLAAALGGFAGGVGALSGGDWPEGTRFFDLPDGRAQIAVLARGEHDIEVAWRDPDGTTWPEPLAAYALVTGSSRRRASGSAARRWPSPRR